MKLEYELIRSKRKTIAININSQGKLTVRAPQFVSLAQISAFVKQNEGWIVSHMAQRRAILAKHTPIEGRQNELIPYLGGNVKIDIGHVKRTSFDGMVLKIPENSNAKAEIVKWYKKQAKMLLSDITQEYATKWGFNYSCVKISSSQKRYGSCSGKNNINYSFRLIMFDLECISYVVVHELCHTIYKDHSRNFWGLVSKICPEYKKIKNKMQQNSALMDVI